MFTLFTNTIASEVCKSRKNANSCVFCASKVLSIKIGSIFACIRLIGLFTSVRSFSKNQSIFLLLYEANNMDKGFC